MKIIKTRLNQWLDNKHNSLINRIKYINRADYLSNCALNSIEQGISREKYCNDEIIVSLTTYSRRLYDVYLAIESIMQQTLKPNKIILWLSDEFKQNDIPLTLQKQQNRGLEIRYCKDIGPYTKLIPALMDFPSAAIITIDDDCLYYFDLIENLVNSYKKNPNLISCARMHQMKLINNNTFEKYEKWLMKCEFFDISPLNFPTGVGGVLYPPHCFNEEIFNENIFMNICKYADDVWFKAMALLNNVSSKKIYTHNKNGEDYFLNKNIQDIGLFKMNIYKGMNDIQLKSTFDKYNLYEKLIDGDFNPNT